MFWNEKIHLRSEEQVVAVFYRSFFTYFWGYLAGLICWLVGSFFIFQLLSKGGWGQVILLFLFLFGLFCFFRTWFFARNNYLLLTNERAVVKSRISWSVSSVAMSDLFDLADVSVVTKGFFAHFFNYGDIILKNKDRDESVVFFKLSNPIKVQSLILQLSRNFNAEKKFFDMETVFKKFLRFVPDLPVVQLKVAAQAILDSLNQRDSR